MGGGDREYNDGCEGAREVWGWKPHGELVKEKQAVAIEIVAVCSAVVTGILIAGAAIWINFTGQPVPSIQISLPDANVVRCGAEVKFIYLV